MDVRFPPKKLPYSIAGSSPAIPTTMNFSTPSKYRKIKKTEFRLDKALGYIYFIDKKHPLRCGRSGYVWLHRHVLSVKLNRWLTSKEQVHHIDGNKTNNSLNNLVSLNPSEHTIIHHGEKKVKSCQECGTITTNKKFCSYKCLRTSQRKITAPSRRKARKMVKVHTIAKIARTFNVSWHTIKKWIK